ncbi:SusC/RagA family TonB-linked outer membrane protein [Cesiribacter sp. SM1]|uniref:SusC/RagA family TonB-linked outer membrane protein n=1 Tax=Cesiribacter sp. SM1 TaxID=2861196 RepID=UPI001CD2B8AF
MKGKVTDENGQGMMGVAVKVKDTPTGTVTDLDGNYNLVLPQGMQNPTLIFSFLGYITEEIVVGNQSQINVALYPDIESLDEVIVVGYGTTTRKNITTAVAKVDPQKVPAAANQSVTELLFGRAAGLQVNQQSSQPGGNIDISVRGKGAPLIVIDGVVYPSNSLEPDNGGVELQGVNRGPLAGLNPRDIESIEILKDASAAIYGVAAANGVMLITTKKGKAGGMNIGYDASRSLVSNMPYLEPLNARDYMTYYNQLGLDKYLADNGMKPFGTKDPAGYQPRFTEEEISAAGEGTDWLDQVLRTGSIDNHNLSVSGGTDKTIYYFSGNYYNQKGTVAGSDMTRYSGRLNVSFMLNDIFTLNTSLNANRNNYTNPQAGWQTGGAGTQGFNALQAALGYPSWVPTHDQNGEFSQFGLIGNPLSLLTIKDQTEATGLIANASLDIDIIPNTLSGRISFGNNNEYSVRDFYIPKTVFWGQINRARASLAEARRENQTMEATLTFDKKIKDFMRINAVTGVGQYIDKYQGFGVEAFDIEDAINTDALETATGPKNIFSDRDIRKYRSFFIRSSFDVLDRYLVTLTLRRDGADRFFPNNKYQNFPAVSVGWKLSNEGFMQGIDQLDMLKLRASYGLTGERPGDLAYGAFRGDNTAITFNNGSVVYIPYSLVAFDNPNLQWPITKTLDIGLDFGLFKNRITGSFDWYRENRERLLVNTTTPQLSFISSAPINAGSQQRTGYEFSLNTVNIEKQNWGWNSTFNFTHYDNRWTERYPNDPPPQYGRINDPLGIIYVYRTNGILQQDQEVPVWQPEGARVPGSPLFVDRNGDEELDYRDVTSFSGVPKAIIGLGNEFRYKNFDLNVFFYGQYGAWGYDYTTQWGDPIALLSNLQNVTVQVKEAWSTSNPTGTRPGAAFNESAVALDAGIDTRLARRDFLRCRNITLGYNVKTPFTDKLLDNLRLYVDVQNAFILTGFKGVDPEIQAAAIKGGPAPYPMARTFSLGLNANF